MTTALQTRDYEKDLFRVCGAARAATSELSTAIDFFAERVGDNPRVLFKYIQSYEHRLGYNQAISGCGQDSLAALEHYGSLHNHLARVLETLVPHIEKETELRHDLDATKRDIACTVEMIAEFRQTHSNAIAVNGGHKLCRNAA